MPLNTVSHLIIDLLLIWIVAIVASPNIVTKAANCAVTLEIGPCNI
jgi:hypothetical protein